ncbi:hypothetical protein C1I95_21130 [Micromonospora craterilacus]|uniref:Uncharacterized protein n=1 Tax=Micromonospora craterilacus TaxID=1655439 RepID=A0A2W2ECQ6_9ACTN|nr:hypothetical protein [Micromonospora craterilacus]PZG14689.1 hypothetical protein C1I95_21130 [Micromonospora craterilacus]
MSISVVLVPLAVAAVVAVQGVAARRDQQGRVVCQVQTRMRDERLLAAALHDTAAVVGADRDTITADWAGVRANFQRDADGIWSAHFTGEVDEERAVEVVRAIDTAYGRQVQRAVLERLRQQAPAAGLRLESEQVTEDASVRLVFAVEGRS